MTAGAPTVGGLKRLDQLVAGQAANAVAITGGTLTGVTVADATVTAPAITLATITLATSRRGTFTCNGETPVVVANANVTANSQILITLKTVGGTVGATPAVKTITASTGFTVAGTASDTSVYNYAIIG